VYLGDKYKFQKVEHPISKGWRFNRMILSDEIRQAIRDKVPDGTILSTSGSAEFEVAAVERKQIVFRVGEKRQRIVLSLVCVNDLVKEFKLLPQGKWLRIGAGKTGYTTLADIIQPHTSGRNVASYFAAVLVKAGIAEIDASRPAKMRLLV
jgi:hypothetical protein